MFNLFITSVRVGGARFRVGARRPDETMREKIIKQVLQTEASGEAWDTKPPFCEVILKTFARFNLAVALFGLTKPESKSCVWENLSQNNVGLRHDERRKKQFDTLIWESFDNGRRFVQICPQ